jgi:DNA-binding MarR family transcriptional regulator
MIASSLDALGLAREIAPEVDRLFRAGHRAAAPRVQPVRERFQLQTFGALIDLRKLLLAPAGMLLKEALALERYQAPERVAEALQGHVEEGLVRRDGDVFRPTERGRAVLLALTEVQEEAVSNLWVGREERMPELSALLDRAAERAAATLPAELYPAFTAERQGYMPTGAAPAYRIWSLLATLRYLRADAHALAWREAALTTTQILVISALWRDPGQTMEQLSGALPALALEEVLGELRQRGWARQRTTGWVLTEAGRERREHIEFRTNALAASPFIALVPAERDRVLALLRGLPDAAS